MPRDRFEPLREGVLRADTIKSERVMFGTNSPAPFGYYNSRDKAYES